MSQQDGGKRPAEGYENTAKRQKSGEADGRLGGRERVCGGGGFLAIAFDPPPPPPLPYRMPIYYPQFMPNLPLCVSISTMPISAENDDCTRALSLSHWRPSHLGSAAAAADPYPGYDYDASSGW